MKVRYHVTLAYVYSGFAFGLSVLQPKDWEITALVACILGTVHLCFVP